MRPGAWLLHAGSVLESVEQPKPASSHRVSFLYREPPNSAQKSDSPSPESAVPQGSESEAFSARPSVDCSAPLPACAGRGRSEQRVKKDQRAEEEPKESGAQAEQRAEPPVPAAERTAEEESEDVPPSPPASPTLCGAAPCWPSGRGSRARPQHALGSAWCSQPRSGSHERCAAVTVHGRHWPVDHHR